MERFDAVVVGAGPAGSVSAYHLARAGASVLLLDRARFPRDKPCGGGLTGRAVRLLPFSVDPVVEDVVDRFEFGFRYGSRFERRAGEPIALMTQRRRLDAFLVERAAEAGAELREATRVTEVSPDGKVRANGYAVEGDVVVIGDGANGKSPRQLGLAGRYTYGVALEGNVPYGDVPERRYRGRAVIELGIVPGGYGWVFAKGDHANVGVGGWEEQGPRLRSLLAELCEAHCIRADRVTDLRGYRLPLRRPGDRSVQGRAVLVGDAAGLVDPISGDGMYEAFLSARLATASALDLLSGRASSLDGYAAALSGALDGDAWTSWLAKLAFDRFPRLTYTLARSRRVWSFVDRLLRGEVGHASEAEGLVRMPLKVIARLGSNAAATRYTVPRAAA